MDTPSHFKSDKIKGKQKETYSIKKDTHDKKGLQQHEYDNIIKHIINDRRVYTSTFGDIYSKDRKSVVSSVNAFFKCKEEISNKLQENMDKARNQLHPPYDNRYKENVRKTTSCENAIKEVLQKENPNEQERLLQAWCVSRNEMLSEATKQVLEAREPEEMKQRRAFLDDDHQRQNSSSDETLQTNQIERSYNSSSPSSNNQKELLAQLKCFYKLKGDRTIREDITNLRRHLGKCKGDYSKNYQLNGEKIAAIHSIQEQLRLIDPPAPSRELVNKTEINLPDVTSKRKALHNILNFRVDDFTATEKNINDTIKSLNDKIKKEMKNESSHDKNPDAMTTSNEDVKIFSEEETQTIQHSLSEAIRRLLPNAYEQKDIILETKPIVAFQHQALKTVEGATSFKDFIAGASDTQSLYSEDLKKIWRGEEVTGTNWDRIHLKRGQEIRIKWHIDILEAFYDSNTQKVYIMEKMTESSVKRGYGSSYFTQVKAKKQFGTWKYIGPIDGNLQPVSIMVPQTESLKQATGEPGN